MSCFFQHFFLSEEIYGFNLCLSLYEASMMLLEKEKISMNVFFSNEVFHFYKIAEKIMLAH